MSFKLSVKAEEDIIAIAEQGARMFGVDQARRSKMSFSHYLS